MSKLVDIVESVSDDLETLPLPAHSRWKYLDPGYIDPSAGPMLAVYMRQEHYRLMDTSGAYTRIPMLYVTWYIPTTGLASGTFGPQQDEAKAALEVGEEILLPRLETYVTGFPGLPLYAPYGVLAGADFGMTEGGIWMSQYRLSIEDWS